MILVNELLNTLKKNKISFYTGVPDSVLKNLSNYFDRLDKTKHIIAVNEGSAISIGIGYYLSTKKIACSLDNLSRPNDLIEIKNRFIR